MTICCHVGEMTETMKAESVSYIVYMFI